MEAAIQDDTTAKLAPFIPPKKPVSTIRYPLTFERGILSFSIWLNAIGSYCIRPAHLFRPFPKSPTFWRRRSAILPEELPGLIWLQLKTWQELRLLCPERTPEIPEVMLEMLHYLQSELDAELAKQEETPHPDPKVDP